jgi:hypothetical protein
MELTFSGWRRDHGARTIISEDISAIEPSERPIFTYNRGQTYISRSEGGDILVEANANNVHLNGDYQVVLQLSKDDLLALARLALRDLLFGEIADAMRARRKKRMTAQLG